MCYIHIVDEGEIVIHHISALNFELAEMVKKSYEHLMFFETYNIM